MTTIERANGLKKLIIDERDAYSDKSGTTPLLARSYLYKNLPQTDAEKMEEIKAIGLLLNDLNEFSPEDLTRYFLHISIANLYNTQLKREFENYIYSLGHETDQTIEDERKEAYKRVSIINFLKSVDDYSLTESLIERQILIKRHFPWDYAELMAFVNLEKGAGLIKDLFKQNVRYSIIYSNREAWLKKFGVHSFIEYILPLNDMLKEKERVEFQKFCEENGVHVDPMPFPHIISGLMSKIRAYEKSASAIMHPVDKPAGVEMRDFPAWGQQGLRATVHAPVSSIHPAPTLWLSEEETDTIYINSFHNSHWLVVGDSSSLPARQRRNLHVSCSMHMPEYNLVPPITPIKQNV